MSFGRMNTFIDIIDRVTEKDSEGFSSQNNKVVASVRAYKEEKHGSMKWANMAAFTSADAIFKFRIILDVEIKTGMMITCNTGRYKIISVEYLRGMYIEIAAEKIEPLKA